jgi:formylglycine-generating enzyme required for sulfatase activity
MLSAAFVFQAGILSACSETASTPLPPDGGSNGPAPDAGSNDPSPDAGGNGPPTGMVTIPAGSFAMGSPAGESGRDEDEGPKLDLTLSAFAMDVTPVTTEAFEARMSDVTAQDPLAKWWTESTTPAEWLGECNIESSRRDHPVNCVNWYAAQAYCRLDGGDLPTEAEWEYAARAGSDSAFWWGSAFAPDRVVSSVACGARGCGDATSAVVQSGQRCNPWGLCDIIGNVWQWTKTDYQEQLGAYVNVASAEAAPKNPVHRGGSWLDNVSSLFRSAHRGLAFPKNGLTGVGFRCVRR